MYYSEDGDAAPAVGLAHEWGHHVQNVVGVPQGTSNAESVDYENQADCIAGAWIAYAVEQGWIDYPDDINDTAGLLKDIASNEPNRDHGNLEERTESMVWGIRNGLQGCNDFYPIVEEGTTPSVSSGASPTSSSSASASP
jgi:predicted metalloprotease